VARLLVSLSWFFAFFVGTGFLLTPTLEHLAFLGLQSARFLLLFLASHVLLVTATPFTVTAAIQWFLCFLGRRRAYFAASMASWALGSVPRLLDQAQTLTEAAALRGVTVSRHPLRWTRLVTLGLLAKTLETAAVTAQALEARCFGAQIPPHGLRARAFDAVVGTGWSLYCLAWLVVR
jgi:energy-coupling factor transporter transmembrane protein EcfT